MSISSSNRKAGPYSGNGVTASFPFSFKVFYAADLVVIRSDVSGAESALELGADYSVALNADQDANPGGTVTVSSVPGVGVSITLTSDIQDVQPVTLTNMGGFYPRVINDALDRLTILVQQLAEKISRSIKYSISSPLGDSAFPPPVANNVIGWNSAANGFQNYAPSDNSLLSAALASNSGASMIGIGGGRTQVDKNAEIVSVKDFPFLAYGDGVADDTAAIQAALDFAGYEWEIPRAQDAEVVLPAGMYRVSSLTVPRRVNLRFLGSSLVPLDTSTSRTHLVKFKGRNKVYSPVVNMNYATNYDTVFWFRGRYIDVFAPEIWKASCCFVFGDPAWETDAASGHFGDSEINIVGGSTNHCITHSRYYGQNTIIQYGGGHQAYSYKWSLPDGDSRKSAWEALPEIAMVNCGAVVYLTGCFTGNYSGAQPNFLSKIQAVDEPGYQNSYGRFILTGTHIESGFHFQCASNGAVPIQDNKTKMFVVNSCSGYISGGRGGYLIDSQNSGQSVDVRNSNFYGNVGDLIAYGASNFIHIDRDSYESNATDFSQKIEAQRVYGYSDYIALNANNSGQTFSPTPSNVKFQTLLASSIHSLSVAASYNSTTGVFTAVTNMRNVDVALNLGVNGGATTDLADVLFVVDGSTYQTVSTNGFGIVAGCKIPKLSIGQTLEVRVAQYQSKAVYGGTGSSLVISASV